MVVGFVARMYQPLGTSDGKSLRSATAGALLASLVADVNVLTDWAYFAVATSGWGDRDCDADGGEVVRLDRWLRTLHLVVCVVGSLSWLTIASDGWSLEIARRVRRCRGDDDDGTVAQTKPSNRATQLAGVVAEDLLQIVITLFVEHRLGRGLGRGALSAAAQANVTLAAIDALHKLAEAHDTRNEHVDNAEESALLHRHTLRGHDSYVTSVTKVSTLTMNSSGRPSSWSSAGSGFVVLSTSLDGTVRVWDAVRGRSLRALRHHTSCVNDVCSLGDGRAVTVSDDMTARVVEVSDGTVAATLLHDVCVMCVSASPDGRFFLTGCRHGHIRRWDAHDGSYRETHVYRGHATSIDHLDDDRFVAGHIDSKDVRLWSVQQPGGPILVCKGHSGGVCAVARLDRDGHDFLTGSSDGSVKLWSAGNGRCLKTFKGHTSDVRGVARVDDSRFVSTSHDGTARLWDTFNACCLFTYDRHEGDVRGAVFLPAQMTVATVSHDKTLRVWSVRKHLEDMGDNNDDLNNGDVKYEVDV